MHNSSGYFIVRHRKTESSMDIHNCPSKVTKIEESISGSEKSFVSSEDNFLSMSLENESLMYED